MLSLSLLAIKHAEKQSADKEYPFAEALHYDIGQQARHLERLALSLRQF